MNKSNLIKIIREEIENTLKEQQSSAERVEQNCAAIQKACEAITAAMKSDPPSAGKVEGRSIPGINFTTERATEIVKNITMLLARLAVNRGTDDRPSTDREALRATKRALRTLGRKLGNLG